MGPTNVLYMEKRVDLAQILEVHRGQIMGSGYPSSTEDPENLPLG